MKNTLYSLSHLGRIGLKFLDDLFVFSYLNNISDELVMHRQWNEGQATKQHGVILLKSKCYNRDSLISFTDFTQYREHFGLASWYSFKY